MSGPKTTPCSSCGVPIPDTMPHAHCPSCGVSSVEESEAGGQAGPSRPRRTRFSLLWFTISFWVTFVLSAAVLIGLPMVVPLFDFEGSAGMMLAVPLWFLSGMLVGLVSPGHTRLEPAVATALLAVPTGLYLFSQQTIKTFPGFLYVLFAAVGVMFALVGAYWGERVQFGAPVKDER